MTEQNHFQTSSTSSATVDKIWQKADLLLLRLLGGTRAVTHVTPSRKNALFFVFVVVVSVSYLVFLSSRGLLNSGCDVIMT